MQTTTSVESNWFSTFIKYIHKVPFTELLVGIVVPIVAAWISYALAERATRRKEYNRLFIQIELVKRELLKNNNALLNFTSKYEEKEKLQKDLEFPLPFCKDILIEVLNKLDKIKTEYLYFDNEMLYEKPDCLYILAQKIENLNQKIKTEEFKFCEGEYLGAKQKSTISKWKEEKEQFIVKFKENQDRDIYKEFLNLQLFIEQNLFENLLKKSDLTEENFEILKYIYNCIKEFNAKEDKTKSDVALLYQKLVIFKISPDIIQNGEFDQDTFDLYYKTFEEHNGFEKSLYDMCEKFYKLIGTGNFIEKYELSLSSQKWNDNCSELVLLSDSDLYIAINELYEKIKKLENNFEEEKNNDIKKLYSYSQTITQVILEVITRLEKHQLKIKKWCK